MLAILVSECVVWVKLSFHLLLLYHCLLSPVKIIGCEFLLCFVVVRKVLWVIFSWFESWSCVYYLKKKSSVSSLTPLNLICFPNRSHLFFSFVVRTSREAKLWRNPLKYAATEPAFAQYHKTVRLVVVAFMVFSLPLLFHIGMGEEGQEYVLDLSIVLLLNRELVFLPSFSQSV